MNRHLILLLGLAGCAGSIDAPSLAPRPAERAGVPTPDPAAEPASTMDPALPLKLAGIVAAAQEGHRRFDVARQRAEAAAARAGGQRAGSDAWTEAQQALSALEAAREGVRAAAADLDMLRSDQTHAAAANRGAIDEAAMRIAGLDDEEDQAIAIIAAKLG